MIAQVNSAEQEFTISILANDESNPAQDFGGPRNYIMKVKFMKSEKEMMRISIYPEESIGEGETTLVHTIQWRNKK